MTWTTCLFILHMLVVRSCTKQMAWVCVCHMLVMIIFLFLPKVLSFECFVCSLLYVSQFCTSHQVSIDFFSLHYSFWSFAFKTATYLTNRLPTPLLQFSYTYQKLFNCSPNYYMCLWFPLLPSTSSLHQVQIWSQVYSLNISLLLFASECIYMLRSEG